MVDKKKELKLVLNNIAEESSAALSMTSRSDSSCLLGTSKKPTPNLGMEKASTSYKPNVQKSNKEN